MNTKLASIVAAVSMLSAASTVRAETIFYGPTPYLSAADSPFDLSELGTTFWLEDFEDGELNTPGACVPGLEHHPESILRPEQGADSVDADDGVIDGFGRGRAMRSFEEVCSGLGCYGSIYFEFDADLLGSYPNYVGIVATDVFPFPSTRDSRVGFAAYDRNGIELGGILLDPYGDSSVMGQTAEDRFVGVYSDTGVSSIYVSGFPGGWLEVDHLQYGFAVPEPTALRCMSTGLFVLTIAFLKNIGRTNGSI